MNFKKLVFLEKQLLSYWLARKIGFPKILPTNLTLNVTYHCNSRCSTCNIWKKKASELTLDEWVKIFKKYQARVFWLILSGGEPFLRPDLVDLAITGYKYLQPAVINIPTNGILTPIILKKVEAILKGCSNSNIVINFSIDGISKNHDKIRNVPGNFKKLIKSYKKVKKLKQKYSNLTVGLHSVVSRFNIKDIPNLCDYCLKLEPDQYITEIAEQRVELGTMNKNISPTVEQYSDAIDYVLKKIETAKFKGLAKITEALRMEYYKLIVQILQKKAQAIPCYAGLASGQISADGQVWPCCVRADNLGNLRNHDYDFRQIWFSEKAEKARRAIRNKECYCPLASANYTNMLLDVKTLFKITKRLFK